MSSLLLILGLLAVVLVVVGTMALITGIRRGQERDNEVVPGVPTPAPASWAGAHTAEARLHRRLRDSVRALRAQAVAGVPADQRATLEQSALDIDSRLVAIAALPERLRAEHLVTAEAAVAALEDAAGMLLSRSVEQAASTSENHLSEIAERLRLLEEARAELDAAVPPVTPSTDRRQDPGAAT